MVLFCGVWSYLVVWKGGEGEVKGELVFVGFHFDIFCFRVCVDQPTGWFRWYLRQVSVSDVFYAYPYGQCQKMQPWAIWLRCARGSSQWLVKYQGLLPGDAFRKPSKEHPFETPGTYLSKKAVEIESDLAGGTELPNELLPRCLPARIDALLPQEHTNWTFFPLAVSFWVEVRILVSWQDPSSEYFFPGKMR